LGIFSNATNHRSWGYHGDGKAYEGIKIGRILGSNFSFTDTVGCGVNFINNELFWTLNGKIQGTLKINFELRNKTPIYALVGMDHPIKLVFNFGPKFMYKDLNNCEIT